MPVIKKPDNRPKVPRTGGMPVGSDPKPIIKEKEDRPTRSDPFDDPQDPNKAPYGAFLFQGGFYVR